MDLEATSNETPFHHEAAIIIKKVCAFHRKPGNLCTRSLQVYRIEDCFICTKMVRTFSQNIVQALQSII